MGSRGWCLRVQRTTPHGRGRHNGTRFERESRPRAPRRGDGNVGNAAKPPEIVDAHADRSRGTLREPPSRSLVAGMGNGPRVRVRRPLKVGLYT